MGLAILHFALLVLVEVLLRHPSVVTAGCSSGSLESDGLPLLTLPGEGLDASQTPGCPSTGIGSASRQRSWYTCRWHTRPSGRATLPSCPGDHGRDPWWVLAVVLYKDRVVRLERAWRRQSFCQRGPVRSRSSMVDSRWPISSSEGEHSVAVCGVTYCCRVKFAGRCAELP